MRDSIRNCQNCGVALGADAVRGHCPICLLSMIEREPAGATLQSEVPEHLRWFGDYELLEQIARGGMGVVYRARQRSLHRIVAVKMILAGEFAQPAFVQRFKAEAQAAASLRHPHIVTVHEVGEQDGQHYFSMEYIDGGNLAELVRSQPLPANTAARYLRAIAEAVEFAHQRGILHRDLKPSNILIDPFDEPRITDFGLARRLTGDAELTLTGQTLGSPGYMSPEQVAARRGDLGPATDIYSLGAVLYHLLTGRPPFQADTLSAILLQVRDAEPVSPRLLNPGTPRDLETICLKCLEKDPSHRYASAAELAEELTRFLRQEPIRARPAPLAEKAFRWCRRRPALAALTLALFLAVGIGFFGVLSQWTRAERHRERVERSEQVTRLNLYAADMSAAALAVDRGDFGLARVLLDAHVPGAGMKDLRGFEWYFLNERCHGQQIDTLAGHEWIVTCAAFSADARLLATGSQDHTVRIWDRDRATTLTNFVTTTGAVWSVLFTADSRRLITSASDNLVQAFAVSNWSQIHTWPGRLSSCASTAPLLATSEGSPFRWEPAGRVAVWDYESGRMLREFPDPGRNVALSPDGTRLAIAHPERGVSLWSTETGVRMADLPSHSMIWSLAFSPDGAMVVGTSFLAAEVFVWNLTNVAAPVLLTGHTRTAWCARFSPDGHQLITTGSDRSVRLWDTTRWEQTAVLRGHQNEVWCGAFSPDSRIIASGGKDRLVMLWTNEPVRRVPAIPNRASSRPLFSPDGKWLLTTTQAAEGWTSILRDVNTRQPVHVMQGSPIIGFSPDGALVAQINSLAQTLEYFEPGQSQPIRSLPLGASDFAASGFSRDWRFFHGVRGDGETLVWDTDSGEPCGRLAGLQPPIRTAVLSPDGHWLAMSAERPDASGGWGSSLFHVRSGTVRLLNTHKDHLAGQAFSDDGRLLATASVDGTIKLWEVSTGMELATLSGSLEEATDVSFSPDGQTLASVEQFNCLKLWHVPTRRELVSLPLGTARLFVRFSPDGQHLAVSTEEDGVPSVSLFSAPRLTHF